LSKVIYSRKEYAFLREMTSMQRGFLIHSWEWERRCILRVKIVPEYEPGRGF